MYLLLFFLSVHVSDCEIVELQTFSFSRKRGASVALDCEQQKRTKAIVVGAHEDAREGSAYVCQEQSSTAAQRNAIAAHSDVAGPAVGSEPQIDLHLDICRKRARNVDESEWNAWERALIEAVEDYLKRSDFLIGAITDLEQFPAQPRR